MCASSPLNRSGRRRGGEMTAWGAAWTAKWASNDGGGVRTVHRRSDIWKGEKKEKTCLPLLSKPREQRQERSRKKASNPNLFIPNSNVTIPAYKAECKQGRLQAKQHFPCHMDRVTARMYLPGESVLHNQWVSPNLLFWQSIVYFFKKHKEITFSLSLGCCVEFRRASTVCFQFTSCTCWFSDLWLVFGIKPFLGQLHAHITRCSGFRLETLLFLKCAICTLDKRCNKSC